MEDIIIQIFNWLFKSTISAGVPLWQIALFVIAIMNFLIVFKLYFKTRKTYTHPDKCNRGQARIYFKRATNDLKGSIYEFYLTSSAQYKNKILYSREDIFKGLDDFFLGIYDELLDELSHFVYADKNLSEYLESNSKEFFDIKTHLLTALEGDDNESKKIAHYLKTKLESMNSSFGLYLKNFDTKIKKAENE